MLIRNRFLGNRCLHQQGELQTWRGVDLLTGAPVVVKVAPLQSLRAGAFERVSRDEATLAEVGSPLLLPPLHCGVEGPCFSWVAPCLPGETLAERLARGPLSIEESLQVGRGILQVLRVAHAHGLLHRHIQPSHVILGVPGNEAAVLVDFGLSPDDLRESSSQALSPTAVLHLSPEQAGLVGTDVGPASDLYAVGVLLFECLAGAPPFQGTTLGELLRQHLTVSPELRARGVSVPRALEQVVQHLLHKDPWERYQSAEATLEDLAAFASQWERGVLEPTVVVGRSDRRRRLAEPAFIGRGRELQALEGALDATFQGDGELVVLEGVSGSGKTLLLDELARQARARGMWVLRGQGEDHVALRPLQVLSGVFEDLMSTQEEDPSLGAAVCARMGGADRYHDVCEAVPLLSGGSRRPEPLELGPEKLAEGRTASALATLLNALGGSDTPALVLLDDCQWADELSLKLLTAWRKPLEETPPRGRFVTVVASFRSEEVPEGHGLRRLEASRGVTVPPLEAPDIRRLAESMAGKLPEEALESVVRLSSGNAFMATAVVRGLVESGALVPSPSGWRVVREQLAETRSSRQATSFLLRRLEMLPKGTRCLLTTGALLGREFEVEVAAALRRLPVEQAVSMLEEARQRHIVWPREQSGRYVFAHDRLRETLLEGIPAGKVRELHELAALELERRMPDRSFEIASHFEAAGALPRAWPHALEAAREARSRHVLEVAEHYYRIADRGSVEADDATRMGILEGLGDVLLLRMDTLDADRCFERAQAFASTRLDFARLEGRRGDVQQERLNVPSAIRSYKRSLQLLGQSVPGSSLSLVAGAFRELIARLLLARRRQRLSHRSPPLEGEAQLIVNLLVQLARICWIQKRAKLLCLWTHLRGLNIAERHAPSQELAATYATHSIILCLFIQALLRVPASLTTRTLAHGRWYSQIALDMAQASRGTYAQGWVRHSQQYLLLHCGRFADSIDAGREAERLFRRAGDQWLRLYSLLFLAEACFMAGELATSFDLGKALQRQAKDSHTPCFLAAGLLMEAFASEGHLPPEPLASALARPAPATGKGGISHLSRGFLLQAEGLRLLALGEAEQAASTFSRGLQSLKACAVAMPPKLHPWLATAFREAAAQVPLHDHARRARYLRQAKATARQILRLPGSAQAYDPHALRELGLLAAIEGRAALARRCFNRSLAIAERLGMRYEHARTLLARAQVGATLGWPDAPADAAAGEAALRSMRPAREPIREAEPHTNLSLVDRFPRILEAGRTIASALTQEAVFEAVREVTQGLLRGEEYVLVEVKAGGSPGPEGLDEASRAFIQRALEAKRPVVPSTQELESAGRGGRRSVLVAPILVRGRVTALFRITHHKVSQIFGPEEARIAEFIATLAGAALENAQGFAEVKALSAQQERLYQQAQAALRKRDEFLTLASHELRTPFTPMRLYMQALLNGLRDPARASGLEPWVAKLELANTRLQRLARLVEDLFDVSHLIRCRLPMRPSQVDLSVLATGAVDRWKEELARVMCPCTLEAPEPVVGHWDETRLEQVIDHLLSNALKFGPGKPIHLTVKREGESARLTVRDAGIGIAPEDHARIFERFERGVSENYGGLGMGLWISRRVLQAHGGRISVQSAPGQGTTFTVELPLRSLPLSDSAQDPADTC